MRKGIFIFWHYKIKYKGFEPLRKIKFFITCLPIKLILFYLLLN